VIDGPSRLSLMSTTSFIHASPVVHYGVPTDAELDEAAKQLPPPA
jgi:hypothetical protein